MTAKLVLPGDRLALFRVKLILDFDWHWPGLVSLRLKQGS